MEWLKHSNCCEHTEDTLRTSTSAWKDVGHPPSLGTPLWIPLLALTVGLLKFRKLQLTKIC